jgi:hypothetical protein
MRLVMLKGIADVQKGLDPRHTIRDPELNDIVYVRGDDEMERFRAEREAPTGARS